MYIIINAGDASIPGPNVPNAAARKLPVTCPMNLTGGIACIIRHAANANTGG